MGSWTHWVWASFSETLWHRGVSYSCSWETGLWFVLKLHGFLAAGFVHNREFLDLVSLGQRVMLWSSYPSRGRRWWLVIASVLRCWADVLADRFWAGIYRIPLVILTTVSELQQEEGTAGLWNRARRTRNTAARDLKCNFQRGLYQGGSGDGRSAGLHN